MTPTAAAIDEVKKCVEAIRAKTGTTIEVTRVVWSDKMYRTWGVASIKPYNGKRQYVIKLASQIFKADTPELRNTVAHEVAHLADFQLYNGWGHGRTWRHVMRTLLGRNPERCVTEEEKAALNVAIPKRLITKYEYACGCSKFLLGGAKHKNANAKAAVNGHTGLRCRKCHEYVKFTGNLKKA